MKERKRLSEDAHCAATDVPQAGLPRVEFDEFAGTGYDEWKEAAIAALKGAPFEKSMFTQTYEGIKLKPVKYFSFYESPWRYKWGHGTYCRPQ